MSKPKVYLAGPITGESWGTATDWRKYVIEQLSPDIDGFSPLRAKNYLNEETNIADSYEAIVLSSQRGIFARDSYDCMNCDLILVNLLGASKVSIGTVMEIAWGWAFRKPIILVMEDDANIHEHSMLREACPFRVRTLDEGIHITKALLLPVPH